MKRKQRANGAPGLGQYDAALHPPPGKVWGVQLCGPCNNGAHKDCMWGKCECLCHTAVRSKKRQKADALEYPLLPDCGAIKIG